MWPGPAPPVLRQAQARGALVEGRAFEFGQVVHRIPARVGWHSRLQAIVCAAARARRQRMKAYSGRPAAASASASWNGSRPRPMKAKTDIGRAQHRNRTSSIAVSPVRSPRRHNTASASDAAQVQRQVGGGHDRA